MLKESNHFPYFSPTLPPHTDSETDTDRKTHRPKNTCTQKERHTASWLAVRWKLQQTPFLKSTIFKIYGMFQSINVNSKLYTESVFFLEKMTEFSELSKRLQMLFKYHREMAWGSN